MAKPTLDARLAAECRSSAGQGNRPDFTKALVGFSGSVRTTFNSDNSTSVVVEMKEESDRIEIDYRDERATDAGTIVRNERKPKGPR